MDFMTLFAFVRTLQTVLERHRVSVVSAETLVSSLVEQVALLLDDRGRRTWCGHRSQDCLCVYVFVGVGVGVGVYVYVYVCVCVCVCVCVWWWWLVVVCARAYFFPLTYNHRLCVARICPLVAKFSTRSTPAKGGLQLLVLEMRFFLEASGKHATEKTRTAINNIMEGAILHYCKVSNCQPAEALKVVF
jgi:hypothetical protein